ncbi:sure-like protein [Xylona heveae TC161]|uniref:Sure-like protein n=1 Tax=Xylona heveae (strain CBS 132557 / TC161) TaxID=1328760 RepID=A0A165A0H9_XYLHT|nr:sure-like protein [Xylona heveae TC161]KZF19776.1 sure-like protein [Xylona heveae TC161]
MHILVVNDDGPPSNQSSPYVHSLVSLLQAAGHTVSVVLPHKQRSWIGKAHMVGANVKPTYFRPGTLHKDDGTTHSRPLPPGAEGEEWVLVDSTPASCVQIGLYHFFQDRGPVDLVVSGPNYGRNSTAVFGLSSGTIGGAMEAAVCRKKAIALSYAFFSRNHDPVIIAGASRLSVRLIEYLYNNWDPNTDVYSVNVPLLENVEKSKILYTPVLQNYWSAGRSSFQEVEVEDEDDNAEEHEEHIRQEEAVSGGASAQKHTRHKHKHFKWAPNFSDVYQSVEESAPGNDGWAVQRGYTSVTPLKANFMHAGQTTGEITLPTEASLPLRNLQSSTPTSISANSHPFSTKQIPHFYAHIEYEDAYVQPLILAAIKRNLDPSTYTLVNSFSDIPNPESDRILQIAAYESLAFEHLFSHPKTILANSYVIRKALIRKHFLSSTITTWTTKHPDSVLKQHTKPAVHFEVDYAEFLDDALVDAFDLHESWARNAQIDDPRQREWWILKPGMSDRGQGIRLFSTEEELTSIFEQWEEEQPDSDDDEEAEDESDNRSDKQHDGDDDDDDAAGPIITSQLRHFIAQPYIHPPLLLSFPDQPPEHQASKFHIRVYVLAVGALKVYVYNHPLALFAATPYQAPGADSGHDDDHDPNANLGAHLTNTCFQSSPTESSVRRFWDLPDTVVSDRPLDSASSGPLYTSASTSASTSTSTSISAERERERERDIEPESTRGRVADSVSNKPGWKSHVFDSICRVTGDLFLASARSMPTHFQPLPNAFELYGLDFLVDADANAYLLEVNAFPDFAQTGEDLKGVVQGLWDAVVQQVVRPFFDKPDRKEEEEKEEEEKEEEEKEEEEKEEEEPARKKQSREKDALTMVLDVDLGRG